MEKPKQMDLDLQKPPSQEPAGGKDKKEEDLYSEAWDNYLEDRKDPNHNRGN